MEEVRKVTRKMRLCNKDDPTLAKLNYTHREQLSFFLQVAINEVLQEKLPNEPVDMWRDVIDVAIGRIRPRILSDRVGILSKKKSKMPALMLRN